MARLDSWPQKPSHPKTSAMGSLMRGLWTSGRAGLPCILCSPEISLLKERTLLSCKPIRWIWRLIWVESNQKLFLTCSNVFWRKTQSRGSQSTRFWNIPGSLEMVRALFHLTSVQYRSQASLQTFRVEPVRLSHRRGLYLRSKTMRTSEFVLTI